MGRSNSDQEIADRLVIEQLDRLRIDPVSGRTRGIELILQRDAAGRVAWSANYGLASATERTFTVTPFTNSTGQTARFLSSTVELARQDMGGMEYLLGSHT